MRKLSVVMPSYNKEKYINEAIESVLRQKVDFEYMLYIADDASTDNSPKIIREYEDMYPDKVRGIYSNENRGIFGNMQPIFARLDTEYFCVLDSDDYYTDFDFLQNAVDFLDENPDYVCYGANTIKMIDGMEKKWFGIAFDECSINSIESHFLENGMAPHTSASVYRNVVYNGKMPEFIKKVTGTLSQESFRADTGRYMMHLKYGKVYIINKVVSVYRIHSEGVWGGTSQIHHIVLQLRAYLDYMDYYEGRMQDAFMAVVKNQIKLASAALFRMAINNTWEELGENDMENYGYGVSRLKEIMGSQTNESNALFDAKGELAYFLSHKQADSLIIWGTGGAAERLMDQFGITENEISFFVDNNEKKCGQIIRGKDIKKPNEIAGKMSKMIVIATSFYEEVKEQIAKNNYSDQSRVINLYRIDKVLSALSG